MKTLVCWSENIIFITSSRYNDHQTSEVYLFEGMSKQRLLYYSYPVFCGQFPRLGGKHQYCTASAFKQAAMYQFVCSCVETSLFRSVSTENLWFCALPTCSLLVDIGWELRITPSAYKAGNTAKSWRNHIKLWSASVSPPVSVSCRNLRWGVGVLSEVEKQRREEGRVISGCIMCRVILIRAAHQIIIVNWETEKRYWSMHELERKSRNWLSSADDDQEQWSSDQWSLRALSIIARSESQVSGCRAAGDGLMLAQCLMSWEWSVLDHQSPGPDTLVLSVEDISVINKCQHQATISRTFQLSIKVSADFITILFIRTCSCGIKNIW